MKEKLIKVFIINTAITVICMFVGMGPAGFSNNDFMSSLLIAAGLSFLGLSILNIIVGASVALAFGKGTSAKAWGLSILLCGAILMLCSGTFCTIGFVAS